MANRRRKSLASVSFTLSYCAKLESIDKSKSASTFCKPQLVNSLGFLSHWAPFLLKILSLIGELKEPGILD